MQPFTFINPSLNLFYLFLNSFLCFCTVLLSLVPFIIEWRSPLVLLLFKVTFILLILLIDSQVLIKHILHIIVVNIISLVLFLFSKVSWSLQLWFWLCLTLTLGFLLFERKLLILFVLVQNVNLVHFLWLFLLFFFVFYQNPWNVLKWSLWGKELFLNWGVNWKLECFLFYIMHNALYL